MVLNCSLSKKIVRLGTDFWFESYFPSAHEGRQSTDFWHPLLLLVNQFSSSPRPLIFSFFVCVLNFAMMCLGVHFFLFTLLGIQWAFWIISWYFSLPVLENSMTAFISANIACCPSNFFLVNWIHVKISSYSPSFSLFFNFLKNIINNFYGSIYWSTNSVSWLLFNMCIRFLICGYLFFIF